MALLFSLWFLALSTTLAPPPPVAVNKQTWRDDFWQDSPLFIPLAPWCERLPAGRWPTKDDWNALFSSESIRNESKNPVTIVTQAARSDDWEQGYEPRTYLHGELQTREENWHDLFNAIAWLAFPRTKAAINARHFRAFQSRTRRSGTRSTTQDALTLLDESGVLVACSDAELTTMLTEHRWQELFWRNRQGVQANMDFVILGHSLYEKSLQPYIGLTGKALLIAVGTDYFSLPVHERLAWLDEVTAARLDGLCTQELHPLPLLGIPGWWPDNASEAFYGNAHYFRPKAPQGIRSKPP